MPSFGAQLRELRRDSRDPDKGGSLSQERFLDLLSLYDTRLDYTASQLSKWENDVQTISHTKRELLLGIVAVLYQSGGLKDVESANKFLNNGKYASLSTDEIEEHKLQEVQQAPIFSSSQATIAPRLGQLNDINLRPFMTPNLPEQGIFGRESLLHKVKSLLELDDSSGNIPPLALRGMGGIGKTTLSIAVGRLTSIQDYFPDGILWTALGPSPTVRLELDKWGRSLGIDLVPERNSESCRDRLRSVLNNKRVLIIVDDVWDITQGRFFSTLAGPDCRTVITTRETDIANNLATRNRVLGVNLLSKEASLNLLTHLVPEVALDVKSANKLIEKLECLPLAITLAGRLLANEAEVPNKMRRLLAELIESGDVRLDMPQQEGRLGIDEYNPVSLRAMLALSINRLQPNDLERFAMASVFGGAPLTWDIEAASAVWECSITQAEDTTSNLIKKGLVERRNGQYWMHALLADYAEVLMEERGL